MYYQSFGNSFSESIWNGIKKSFRHGSALTRLIYINLGIFILLKLITVLFTLFGHPGIEHLLLQYLGVPAHPTHLLYTPWTLFTYMFTHFGFLHLLFNLLWLYWFGSMFLNYFSGEKLTGVYLLGGICGALLYIIAYSVFPVFAVERYLSWAVGASASVMAIVFAVCTYLPNHRIYVFLIGPVKLIHLAIFTAIIDIISIPTGNAGGHIAHLGGALFGYLFTLSLRRNRDIASGIVLWLKKLSTVFTDKKKMKVKHTKHASQMNDHEYNEYKKNRNNRINDILDKISKSGYDSLTKEEKELLFKSGQK